VAAREPDAVHVPVFRGERGHPVVLPASLRAPLCAAAPGESPRAVIARAGVRVREHPLDAPGILVDLDTPEELQRWRGTP
jgi:molybdenum cofactor cytidylyltransferase